jgi:hypothetical protein
MTLPELLGGAVGTIVAAFGAYRAISSKVDSVVGKKSPGEEPLRDLIMQLHGKVDANSQAQAAAIGGVSDRLERVERHVFPVPEPPALHVVAAAAQRGSE